MCAPTLGKLYVYVCTMCISITHVRELTILLSKTCMAAAGVGAAAAAVSATAD